MEQKPLDRALDMAEGRWEWIFKTLAPELDEAMKMAEVSENGHTYCPVHTGDNGDAFRLFKTWKQNGAGVCNSCGASTNGVAMLAWLKGAPYKAVLRELFQLLDDGTIPAVRHVATEAEQAESKAELVARSTRNANQVRRIWDESIPVTHPGAELARLYFASRGLEPCTDPYRVRFHPCLYYRDKSVKMELPGLVFRTVDALGRATTLHRIFIDPASGRKANVSIPKRLMSYPKAWRKLSGGGIRLCDAGPEIGVAEGPETAWAVHLATGLPMWSAVSAEMLERIQFPLQTRTIWVWLDKDLEGRGQLAGQRLVERLWREGREAGAFVPDLPIEPGKTSADWLDVYVRQGSAGFPERPDVPEQGQGARHG